MISKAVMYGTVSPPEKKGDKLKKDERERGKEKENEPSNRLDRR